MNLAIRCHPCAPVSTVEVDAWLEAEVERIREDLGPDTRMRLLRLWQVLPSGRQLGGWLLEFEDLDDSDGLANGTVEQIVRDMRLLGLQPTVLAPARPGTAARSVERVAHFS